MSRDMIDAYGGLRAFGALVIEAFLWVVSTIRGLAYAPVMGRYCAYKGNPIDIVELA